jgi:hypothetical protein
VIDVVEQPDECVGDLAVIAVAVLVEVSLELGPKAPRPEGVGGEACSQRCVGHGSPSQRSWTDNRTA